MHNTIVFKLKLLEIRPENLNNLIILFSSNDYLGTYQVVLTSNNRVEVNFIIVLHPKQLWTLIKSVGLKKKRVIVIVKIHREQISIQSLESFFTALKLYRMYFIFLLYCIFYVMPSLFSIRNFFIIFSK